MRTLLLACLGAAAACTRPASPDPARVPPPACLVLGEVHVCPSYVREGDRAVTLDGATLVSTFGDGARRTLGATGPVTLETHAPIVDATFRLALEDIARLRRQETHDGATVRRLDAGESWSQAWTRDTSFSIDLGLAFVLPEETRASLDASVERREGAPVRALQDKTAHFKGFPNLSDAIVWSVGAAEWRKIHGGDVSGDYAVVVGTLARGEAAVRDPKDGLFRGVASFMESHSAYPARFAHPGGAANARIGETKALSTNVLYARGYADAAWMASALGREGEAREWRAKGDALGLAIERAFRTSARSYGYFVDENGALEPRFEALGTFLAARHGLARDPGAVLDASPVAPHGTPCLWPPYDVWVKNEWVTRSTADYYHNAMVWPFVEAYAGWLAAREGRPVRLERSLGFLTELALRDLTHHELHHWRSGRPGGSRAQLWSAAGYIGLFLRGVLGLEPTATELRIAPHVPALLGGRVELRGIRYRGAMVDVIVRGTGREVVGVTVDGVARARAAIPANATGPHTVVVDVK